MSSTPNYVIIDTDAGVDDALALMLAFDCHKKGLIDILAITCVYGNVCVDKVIKNVLLTQRACNTQGLKVYRGAEHPLVTRTGFEDGFFNSDGLGGATNNLDDIQINIETEHAVIAMTRLVKEYPKQITLITLGPMTNLALAHRMDETFFDNLSRIVAMGGLLDSLGNVTPVTEFNFYNDPDSVHVVLTNSKCELSLVPWDTAFKHRIPWEKYDELVDMKLPKTDFIDKIYGWYRHDPLYGKRHLDGLIMCDILCVISAIFPDLIVTSHEYPVAMELSGQLTRGKLIVGRTALIFPFTGSRVINFIEKININDVYNSLVNMSMS